MLPILFAASFWHYVFGMVIFSTSLFLILLVLVQRGRGGGLTGALGGMGGQSAFGAKAGDTFTRVTMVTATIWILSCMLAIKVLGTPDNWGASTDARPEMVAPASGTGDDDDALPGDGLGGAAAGTGSDIITGADFATEGLDALDTNGDTTADETPAP